MSLHVQCQAAGLPVLHLWSGQGGVVLLAVENLDSPDSDGALKDKALSENQRKELH